MEYEHIRRFVGAFLGELYLTDSQVAIATMKKWTTGENVILRHEACRALLWIPPEQFGPTEIEQLHQLVALNDQFLDRMIVGFWGILRGVDRYDPREAVRIVKTVSSRKDRVALNQIAEALEPGGSVSQISGQELSEITQNFVDLDNDDLDHSTERMLMRLFQLNPDAWLAFWEARINREREKAEGEHYFAAPFDLTAESDYVVTSPHRVKVLGAFLEWSSRKDFAFQHNGATLLKLYSGNNSGAAQDVLEEWFASGELAKLRALAKVLKEMGYSDFFLNMAKRLLSATDDELVEAYLSDTLGSTGVVAGSFVPLYKKRKADFEAWLADPQASLRAKVFARQEVARLAKRIELHAKDEWDE